MPSVRFAFKVLVPLVLALALFLTLPAFHRSERQLRRDLAALTNEDVVWDGNYFGLDARLASERAKRLARNREAIPFLVEEMSDERKYIAAHVILGLQSRESFDVSAARWNGLAVHLKGHGQVSFDPEDQRKLLEFWRIRYPAKPDPSK